MALTPQNNDAFFREVDDELRRARLESFGQRYGKWIAIGVVAALALLAAVLWYRHDQAQRAGVAGEELGKALTALSENRAAQARPILTQLSDASQPGYRAAAGLALGDLAMDANDAKRAAATFGAVAADSSLAQPYRDLATIRQVAAEYDTLPPAQVIARLKSLAVPGSPWFGSAAEMTAAAHIKMKRPDLAGPLFAGIAKDANAPGTLRTRAAQMATAMGIDVAVPGANRTGGERQ